MRKKIFLGFIIYMCIFFIAPQYQGLANVQQQKYKWIKEPVYKFEDIDRFDYFEESIPKLGYTGNDLYGISVVKNNNKYNVIDYKGDLLFKDFIEDKPAISDVSKEGTFMYNLDKMLEYDTYGNFVQGMQITSHMPSVFTWHKDKQIVGSLGMGDIYIENSFERAEEIEGNIYIIQEAENIYVEGGVCAFVNDDEYFESSWCVSKNDKFGVVKNKQILIYPKYDEMYEFHDNMAAIRVKDKWGFINEEGKEIIKPKYDSVASFVHGYAPVESNGKFAYINQMGDTITDFEFEKARPLDIQNGYAWVKKDGKWGIIQINGIQEDTSVLVTKDWKQVYTNYLTSDRWIDSNAFYFEGVKFCLLDIDKNGNPVLIIQNNSKHMPENEWCIYVISYDGKKSSVEKLETGYGNFYGYDKQKQLLKITKTKNDKDFKIYDLKDNQYIQKFDDNNISNNSMLYEINDSNIINILVTYSYHLR